MFNDVFKVFLIPSLAGALLVLALTAVRPFTKKHFGAAWNYYIWLAVLAVMLLPIRIHLPQTEFTVTTGASIVENTAISDENTTPSQNTAIRPAPSGPTAVLTIPGNEIVEKIVNNYNYGYLGAIWVSGAVLMLLFHVAGYIRLLAVLKKHSEPIDCPEISAYTDKKVRVRVCNDLASPFILGVFRPVLVLPKKDLTREQLDNILKHEMTHFYRRDILYKWLAMLTKCVHWFNPAVYYASKQINAECEISCDLSVVKRMDADEERSYINTILSLISSEKSMAVPLTTGMAGSKETLKRRFTMIKNRKTTSKMTVIISTVLAVAILAATVLSVGVLAGRLFDDSDISVAFGGKTVTFKNKPFIENSTVYLPLEETLALEGVTDIEYYPGYGEEAELRYAQFKVYTEEPVVYRTIEYDNWLNRVQVGNKYGYIAGHSEGSTENVEFLCAPIDIDGVIYVPYDVFAKMSAEEGVFGNLTVSVRDGDSLIGTLYSSSELNIQIEIPLSLCGKYSVVPDREYAYDEDYGVSFVSAKDNSVLFTLQKVMENSFSNIPDAERKIFISDPQYGYILTFSVGTTLTAAEVSSLKKSFDTIVKFSPSASN